MLMKKIALWGALIMISASLYAQQEVQPYITLTNQSLQKVKVMDDAYKRTVIVGYNTSNELIVSVIDSNKNILLDKTIPYLSIGVEMVSPLGANWSNNYINIFQYIQNNGIATLQQLLINPFTLEVDYDNYLITTENDTIAQYPTYQWIENPENGSYIVAVSSTKDSQSIRAYHFYNSQNKLEGIAQPDTNSYTSIEILQESLIQDELLVLARARQLKDQKSVLVFAHIDPKDTTYRYQKIDILKAEDIIHAQLQYDTATKSYHLISSKMRTLQKDNQYVQFNNTWTHFNTDTTIHKLLRYPTFKLAKRKVTNNNDVLALLPKYWSVKQDTLDIYFEEWEIHKKYAANLVLNQQNQQFNKTGIVAMRFDSTNMASNIAYLPYLDKQPFLPFASDRYSNGYIIIKGLDNTYWYKSAKHKDLITVIEADNNVTQRAKKKSLSQTTVKNVRTHVYQIKEDFSFDLVKDYADIILHHENSYPNSTTNSYLIGWDKSILKKVIYKTK